MALDSYTNLKAHLVRLSGRNDLSDLIPDFILEAEAAIYANTNETLMLSSMETRATAPTTDTTRFISKPDGFLSMRRMSVILDNGYQPDIKFRTPDQLIIIDETRRPLYFAVTSQIEFDVIPDEVYTLEMQYFKRPDALSEANESNIVLAQFPQIYVFGAMWTINQMAAEEEKAEYYYGKFLEAIAGANAQDREGRYGPAPVRRIAGSTP